MSLSWLAASGLMASCSSDADGGSPADAADAADGAIDAADAAIDTGPERCAEGEARCDGAFARFVCDASGAEEREACGEGFVCDEASGACVVPSCAPGEFLGCVAGGEQSYCNASGTGTEIAPCPNGAACEGSGCAAPECSGGAVRCLDKERLELCHAGGAWVPGQTCAIGTECSNGSCEPLCELNKKISSYIGCEYWSVDLDNYAEALSQPHAIVVTNPNPELSAEITITAGYETAPLTIGADGAPFDLTIPAGEARIYSIPVGFDHAGTKRLQDRALRVVSNIPTVAHQFNPLNNVDVYSNDGTLLIPTNAVGEEYWGLSWPHRGGLAQIRGFLTIVNSSGRPNRVTIRPSASIVGGAEIRAWPAGEERVLELAPGESVNLETAGTEFEAARAGGCLDMEGGTPRSTTPCPDLSGTHIVGERPLTVFGGHQCANVVLGVDRCDHVESILFPVSTWGTNYAGTKFTKRADGALIEPDLWRVVAAEEGTQLQTDPPIEGVHGRTLGAGEWAQFEATEPFQLGSSKPVMLAQYMVGSNWTGIPRICKEGQDAFNPTGIGDPAMALAVPVEQFRSEYIILAPRDYEQDYLNVVAPIGVEVRIDGVTIPAEQFIAIGELNRLGVATLTIPDGFHRLEGSAPFGVVSYGYDCHVSYAYPGGLNLETIVERL